MRGGLAARIGLGVLGVAVLLLLWQLIGVTGVIGRSIPPPTEVAATLVERADLLARATGATGMRALVGGAIGLGIGFLVAAITAFLPSSTSVVVRTAVLVNAVPIVAIGPVLMSLDTRPVIPEIFAALAVLFSTVVVASEGFRSASASSRDLFRLHGAAAPVRFLRLQLPSAAPHLADALRLAVPAAILGAVLGEWFGADRGLGVLMVSSMRNIQYSQLWAAAVVCVGISLIGYAIATVVERLASRRFGREGTTGGAVPPIRRSVGVLLGIGIPLLLVVAWQLWISLARIPLIVAPGPVAVLTALVDGIGEFLAAAGVTLAIAAGGVAIGGTIGVLLAIAVTLVPWLSSMLSPLSLLIPTVPIVVFVPIVGSIFGYGPLTVVVSCVLMAFFPVYVLALSGLRARPAGSDDLFRLHGAGRLTTLARLALPAAVPSLLLALRLAAANAILIGISAEWLMGQGGLGRLLSERRVALDTPGSWAAVVLAVVLSVLAYTGASRLERTAGRRWRS